MLQRVWFVAVLGLIAGSAGASGFTTGTPDIRSLSALAFGPEGVLFVGDGKGGAVFALDLGAPRRARSRSPRRSRTSRASWPRCWARRRPT